MAYIIQQYFPGGDFNAAEVEIKFEGCFESAVADINTPVYQAVIIREIEIIDLPKDVYAAVMAKSQETAGTVNLRRAVYTDDGRVRVWGDGRHTAIPDHCIIEMQ